MIEHKAHFAAMAVDLADASAERGDQVVHRLEQHVGDDGAFQVAPQPLDQVQAWTVRRQPIDLDLVFVCDQPLLDGLGAVKAAVVADQTHFAAGVGGGGCGAGGGASGGAGAGGGMFLASFK